MVSRSSISMSRLTIATALKIRSRMIANGRHMQPMSGRWTTIVWGSVGCSEAGGVLFGWLMMIEEVMVRMLVGGLKDGN